MAERKKTYVSVLIVLMLVATIIGVSYAYFTANITGIENASTISLTAGRMVISYAEDEFIGINNIYPREEEWATKRFALTGTNTTELDMTYTLYLAVTENTFSNNALAYTLTGTSPTANQNLVNVANQASIPNNTDTITLGTGKFTNADGVIHNYVLKIFFPDTGEDQNVDQQKVFRARVSVSS